MSKSNIRHNFWDMRQYKQQIHIPKPTKYEVNDLTAINEGLDDYYEEEGEAKEKRQMLSLLSSIKSNDT